MARSATVHHVKIALSDVDRGVYESLDLRVARHPSESLAFMATRLVAYALEHTEGIEFSKGLSTADEPAILVRDLQGRTTSWIEVGTPSAERLHRARKAVDRVVVYTQHDAALLRREAASREIHRAETITVVPLPPAFVAQLEGEIDRTVDWEIVRTGGHVYVTSRGRSFDAPLETFALG